MKRNKKPFALANDEGISKSVYQVVCKIAKSKAKTPPMINEKE